MSRESLPPLPADAPGRPARSRYREQYGVIVLCEDATHQEKVYNELKARDFVCRVVTT